MARTGKALLIGIDSADVDYLESSLDRLPNLRRLFAESHVRRLDSLGDVMAGSVWPTFYTGTVPGEHGQYFPLQWDPSTMRLVHVSHEWMACEPFWRPLARRGLAVTTLDVQSAFPARTADGVEVVNWGVEAFGGFRCNRPEIARAIVRSFGTNPMGFDAPVDKSAARLATMRRTLLASAQRRGELARWLLRQTEWSLFVAVFAECHRAGHYFWPDTAAPSGGALLEVHQAVDREVGTLLDAVDPRETTVVVFSLLGMGPNQSQMHFVPTVMERINAKFRPTGEPPPRSLARLLRERLPATLQERVALAVPESVRDWVIARASVGGFDWRRTPGFALPTGAEGYVRCNVAGREAQGCLPRGGELHRQYLELVREGFRSLTVAATNEPLVRQIVEPAERFPGPRSDYLPDLAISWRPASPATHVCSELLGTFTGRLATGRAGNHRPVAFAAVGGAARTSRRAESLRSILDLSHFVKDTLTGQDSPV